MYSIWNTYIPFGRLFSIWKTQKWNTLSKEGAFSWICSALVLGVQRKFASRNKDYKKKLNTLVISQSISRLSHPSATKVDGIHVFSPLIRQWLKNVATSLWWTLFCNRFLEALVLQYCCRKWSRGTLDKDKVLSYRPIFRLLYCTEIPYLLPIVHGPPRRNLLPAEESEKV